jgi:hypothetical protein
MNGHNYKYFKKFYEENKSKLDMPNGINYPINYKNGKLWADSQCDAESREFANGIVKSTKYVPFSDFFERLKKICMSYKNTYSSPMHDDTLFILIIPFKFKKSNMWVSLLAFEFLKDIVDDVYYDITDVYNNTIDRKSVLYKKNVRCIICDDCAYTGHQLVFISSLDHSWLNYPGKPPQPSVNTHKWLDWHDSINKDAEEYIKKIPIDKFSVDLIVPYMSILAQVKLHRIHYIKTPIDCIVFPIFSQQINIERIPIRILNEFKRTFQYHKDISAIYFDHKIADAVSTFHKIYLLAPLFNCSVNNKRIGFIDNCDKTTIPDNIRIYDYHIDLEQSMDGSICPVSFYKHIKYTFGGKPVDCELYISELFSEKRVHLKNNTLD